MTTYDDALGRARAIARTQADAISRRQLYATGVTRWQVRAKVRSGRWQTVGDQTVVLHNGPLPLETERWAAVFQGGPRACLDGASALQVAGLERFETARIRVSVPRGARVRRTKRFNIRQTRRWSAQDIVDVGIPRTRPATAAIRAALWAASDREAAYVLGATVQQGLATPAMLGTELLRIKSAKRRSTVEAVVHELLDGARTLGEAEVVEAIVRRGLPAPARQVLRKAGARHYYLDLYWPDYHLVVEIDGIHHTWAENVIGDALRQNALVLDGDTVLRLPLLGYRLQRDAFLDQIEAALRAAGWRAAA
jgi:very-short-patch-repair endonuclease